MKIVIFQGEAICSAEVLAGFGRGSGWVRAGFGRVLAGVLTGFGRGSGRVRPGSGRVWPVSGRVRPGSGRVRPEFWQGSADDSVLGSL